MLRLTKEFWRDEHGAVTVDHVVLTAATMGLGLAVMGTISGGLSSASSNVATQASRSIISTNFIQAVTAGLTQTAELQPGESTTHLLSTKRFSIAMDVVLNAEDEGILFEMGATVHGSILYQHDGKLYLQGGDGSGTGPSAKRGEAVWDVADGSYKIEASLDSDTGLALYVDGRLVSQSSFQNSFLGGGDHGSVGGTTNPPRNRGDFVRGDTHPGASLTRIYKDQTTGGEVAGVL